MALYTEHPLNGEGLVWNSEVQIEIDPVPRNSPSTSRPRVTENDRGIVNNPSPPQRPRNIGTPFSHGDADDEWSLRAPSPPLTDVRGRPRSRTKQFRRRGIDLSRDELRISSRWDESEKQSMEDFRSAIRDKANSDNTEGLFTRWGGRSGRPLLEEAKNLKNTVKTFKDSLSRSRQRRGNHDGEGETLVAVSMPIEQDIFVIETPPKSPGPKPTLHSAQSSIFSLRMSPFKKTYDALAKNSNEPFSQDSSSKYAEPCISWQRHLEQDLQPNTSKQQHGRKGRYLLQGDTGIGMPSAYSQSRSVLASDYFPDYSGSVHRGSRSLSRLRPSATISEMSERHLESYWRLPSLAVSASYAQDSRSRGVSAVGARPQKMSDLISSREFDSAWWKDTSTSHNLSSNPSQPVTTIASRSTSTFSNDGDTEHARIAKLSIAELVANMKLKLAEDNDEYESTSVKPLLQPSLNIQPQVTDSHNPGQTHEHGKSSHSDEPSQSGVTTARLFQSMSLPDTCNATSQDNCTIWGDYSDDVEFEMSEYDQVRRQWLELDSSKTEMPYENHL